MSADTPKNREREVFEQALDLPSVEERTAFVKGACGDNAALLERLQSLLLAHERSQFLPGAPQGVTAAFSTPSLAGEHERVGSAIERYKLLEKLGEGGFGAVWLAEQKSS